MSRQTAAVTESLTPFPDDWSSALCIAAHPDDLEYGTASAVAAWTAAGKAVRYVLVTSGEAAIDSLDPAGMRPDSGARSAPVCRGRGHESSSSVTRTALSSTACRCAATWPGSSVVCGPIWW